MKLAGSPAVFDSQGMETPIEAKLLENLGHAASGYMAGNAGAKIAQALIGRAVPALQGLGESGAIFPEGTSPDALPVMARGAKTGDPHALFAYHDNFGPGMSKRALYNVFGDPSQEAVKGAGWGSSVTEDVLKKFGIPIVGKEPPRSF